MNKEEIIIYLHIPKTGGTTLRDIILRQYPHKNVFIIKKIAQSEAVIKRLSQNKKKEICFLMGHMKFGIHENFNKQYRYITILREPVSRVLSQYYYVTGNPYNPHNLSNGNNVMSLKKYFDSGLNQFLSNGQTKLISGILDDSEIEKYPSEILNIAINNLKSEFFFFGLTEKFNESLFLFREIFKWKSVYYSKANRSKKNRSDIMIGENELSLIKKNNKLDIKLYKIATEIFYERFRTLMPVVEKDLKRFNLINKYISPFYAYPRIIRKIKKLINV